MTWTYNAKQHRWEAIAHGWRAIAQRAPNRLDWEAAIEALEGRAREASPVVFRESDAAREWCEAAITRRRLGGSSALLVIKGAKRDQLISDYASPKPCSESASPKARKSP